MEYLTLKIRDKPSFFKSKAFSSITASLLAIASGLIFGLIIMLMSSPADAFPGFINMIGGWAISLGPKGIGNWLGVLAPLLMTGLAVGFAFKSGLFNIGASGQYTVGMFMALFVGVTCDFLGPFQWVAAVLAGALGGLIWGIFPGLFKAYFNVNEVITAIMFNYIGMYAVNTIIKDSTLLFNGPMAQTQPIDKTAYIPTGFLRSIFPGSSIDIAFIIAIIIAIGLYLLLTKTTFGYELVASGLNRDAARYAGINEKRNIVLAMAISGGLAGIGGAFFILASGAYGSGSFYEPVDSLVSAGFNGIAVALLGMSHPIGLIFSAAFITFIERGGNYIQLFGFKTELVSVIIAVIVYFSAFALLMSDVITRFAKKRRAKKKALSGDVPVVEEVSTSLNIDDVLGLGGDDK